MIVVVVVELDVEVVVGVEVVVVASVVVGESVVVGDVSLVVVASGGTVLELVFASTIESLEQPTVTTATAATTVTQAGQRFTRVFSLLVRQ